MDERQERRGPRQSWSCPLCLSPHVGKALFVQLCLLFLSIATSRAGSRLKAGGQKPDYIRHSDWPSQSSRLSQLKLVSASNQSAETWQDMFPKG